MKLSALRFCGRLFFIFVVGVGCGKSPTSVHSVDERAPATEPKIQPSDENADPIEPEDANEELVSEPEEEVVTEAIAPETDGPLTVDVGQSRRPEFYDEYHGLEYQGYVIPHKGKKNRFLAPFGHKTEPTGKIVDLSGFFYRSDFVEGKVSWFGGPKDMGVTPKEVGAITGENLRKLNPHTFYAAMRFDYGASAAAGIQFWKQARLLVVNPKNGRGVIVRPVDWGPNPRLDRILDVSPGALEALGVQTDATLWVAFAKPETQLGAVR